MYAIIDDRNKQYRVEEDAEVLVDHMSDYEPGESITFDVLFLREDEDVQVGQPVVEGASVEGSIAGHEKGDKIVVQKFKRRNRYNRTIGHRQQYTRIKIENIKNAGA